MDLGNTVQFNSLKWVKEELRLLLKEAQRQFDQFLESEGEDAARLDEVAAQMGQVRGTLSLVEVYGAALLSEEIEALTEAIPQLIIQWLALQDTVPAVLANGTAPAEFRRL